MKKLRNVLHTAGALVVAAFTVVGGVTVGGWAYDRIAPDERGFLVPSGGFFDSIPVSELPGPPRTEKLEFRLTAETAAVMRGCDDPACERWCDIAGNYYSTEFITQFSYETGGDSGPQVLVEVRPRGSTLCGRLEARRLKPNFTYQIKLRGDYSDAASHEAIGYAGRWRLPGVDTNYTDRDYESYPEKEDIESYILFDFFVTDARGDAVRELALDSSLHVLWNADRQDYYGEDIDVVSAWVDASSRSLYSRPKHTPTIELLWAEREAARYQRADQRTQLPPGRYRAELALTEESFHSCDNDGGYWATVFALPIEFEIIEQQRRADPGATVAERSGSKGVRTQTRSAAEKRADE